MKITVKPPTPPEPAYVLELTKDQLVALGVLSWRHEIRRQAGRTFLDNLPPEVREWVEKAVPNSVDTKATSYIGVDWTANP